MTTSKISTDSVPTDALHGDQHLRTDHLLKDLRKRTLSAGVITAAAQGVKFAVNLLQSVVLARLLLPEDFGLIAMVTTVTALLRVFKDAGLSTATVQRAEVTQQQVSNLFWINVGVSAALSLLVAALAPVIAWFYREPRLISVTCALASTFAVSGAVVQHQALLLRQMRFKAIAVVEIISAVVGLITAIAMAILGFKYWSLVGMQLSTGLTELALTLWISRWRPSPPRRGAGTRAMVRFGASLTVASVFRRIASGVDSLLIGRWYGAGAVGLYTRGAILLMRPIDQLISPLEAVLTPVLSRLQNDPQRYRRVFLQVYSAVSLVSFPAAGLFMALSRPIVLVVLGPKWEQVVPMFAWFTLGGLSYPLYYAGMWLLNTQGRGKDILTAGFIFSFTTIGSFIIGLPFGPLGVAISFSCVGLLVRLPVQYYIAGRSGPISTGDLWRVLLKYLPNAAIVCALTFGVLKVLPPTYPPFLQLLICGPVGGFASLALLAAVPAQRRDAMRLYELGIPFIQRIKGKARGATA